MSDGYCAKFASEQASSSPPVLKGCKGHRSTYCTPELSLVASLNNNREKDEGRFRREGRHSAAFLFFLTESNFGDIGAAVRRNSNTELKVTAKKLRMCVLLVQQTSFPASPACRVVLIPST